MLVCGTNRLVALAMASWFAAATTCAAPYWVAYEGNDFPENEGWGRVTGGGGAIRSIENGVLTLDGSRSVAVNDVYGLRRFPLDPAVGEVFRAEWRMSMDSVVGLYDPGIAIFSDEAWAIGLSFSPTRIFSGFENRSFDVSLVGFQEFVLTSTDMRSYQLTVGGKMLLSGTFVQVISSSQVRWGDGVEGAASLTRWDYVRIGVIPEPSTTFALVGIAIFQCWHPRRRFE